MLDSSCVKSTEIYRVDLSQGKFEQYLKASGRDNGIRGSTEEISKAISTLIGKLILTDGHMMIVA